MRKVIFSFSILLLLFSSLIAFDENWLISAIEKGKENPPAEVPKEEVVQESDPISFKLLPEPDGVSLGKSFLLAIDVHLKEGWKAYWKNPGEVGAPLKLTWHLPDGFRPVELEWAAPERELFNGLVSFAYHDHFTILTEVDVPAQFKETSLPISVDIEWVVCSSERCVPGETTLKTTLPILAASDTPKKNGSLDFAKSQVPQKLEDVWLEPDEDGMMIAFPSTVFPYDLDEAHFFPFAKDTVDLRHEESLTLAEGNYYLFIKPGKVPFLPNIEGVIKLVSKAPPLEKSFLVSVPMKGGVNPLKVPEVPSEEKESLIFSLFLTLIGGVLLNVMPCVLPIISLKIMSFVKLAGESRRLTFLHGLTFSLGVILSFLFLGGLLFFLRGIGMDVGWGFQLQDPTMVAILAGLILLMSLVFFGLFEVGGGVVSKASKLDFKVKRKNPSLLGSFASGILATALSTPCSGPFLGTALGLSMTLPPHLGMLIFLAMGLGMALPYLILSVEPRWLRYVPKPGPWLDTFKQVMGFLLLLTVVWLMWVFLTQADSQEIFEFLFALFLIGFGSWLLGKYGAMVRSKPTRILGRILSLGIFLYALYLLVVAGRETAVFHPSEKTSIVIEKGWETFSAERVDALRAEGVPIFIDFTAKWCLICQSNFLVLESEDVKEAFEKAGVVKMEADWTRSDPEITQALASFGRNSVPLYVYYPRGKDRIPRILPQLLTPSVVLEAIEK